MNPLSFILSLLERLPPVLSATSRLVKATKESEPPVPLDHGASAYLSGSADRAWREYARTGYGMGLKPIEEPKVEEEKPE